MPNPTGDLTAAARVSISRSAPGKITIANTLPAEQWRAFVRGMPCGNIFHTPEMFEVFRRARGHVPELWAALDGSRIRALLTPVRVTLCSILQRLTTRSVVYGGVLCSERDNGLPALTKLLHSYSHSVTNPPIFTELRNLSDPGALQRTLQKAGFSREEHLNYLIDLKRPSDAVFRNIGARTRKNIRHGLRSGKVVIEEITDREKLPCCYDLLRRTFRARRIPLPHPSLFEAAFDVLYPKGMIRFTVARVGGMPAATSVDLLYKQTMYGWYGGVDRTYSAQIPNDLLTWSILQWGSEMGFHVYDFGGAGKPEEPYGVRNFKAKFGGVQVNFGRNRFVHLPVRMQICTLAYSLLKRVLF